MLRVTADTNVLVSGLMFRRGKPFELLRMAIEGEVALAVSEPIIAETLEVLGRKFGLAARELPDYANAVRNAGHVINPAFTLEISRR